MSQEILIGIKKILWLPIAPDGSPLNGGNWVQLGLTYKDSASVKEADPTTFEVNVEETDDPVLQFLTKGKTTIKFSLIDYAPETLMAVKGGTVVSGVWKSPSIIVQQFGKLKILTQTGPVMVFNGVSLVGVINADLKKGAVSLLDITATVLVPLLGEAPIEASEYQPPVVSAGADAAPVVDTYNLVGQEESVGSDSLDDAQTKWTVITKPAGAADPVFTPVNMPHSVVSGLETGVYVLQFGVVDVNGYPGVDTITLTVAL